MWVTALNIGTLVLMVAVLTQAALAARRLEAGLTELLNDQSERLRRMERDLDRIRQALDSISTGVTTLDIRQRMRR